MIKRGSYVVFTGMNSTRHRKVWRVSRVSKDGKRVCVGMPLDGCLWNDVTRFRIATPEEIKSEKAVS